MYNKISFECGKCRIVVTKESDELEILEDEEIIQYNKEVKKHNIQEEQNMELQKIELKEFGKKLEKLVMDKKYSTFNLFNIHKYNLEINNDSINIYTGKNWYVFTEEEAKNFVSKSGLYGTKTESGKLGAYFSISENKKSLKEYKYMLCPLCQHKNFIPLKNAQLSINTFDYI